MLHHATVGRACLVGLPEALVALTLCVVRGKQGLVVLAWTFSRVALGLWLTGDDASFWAAVLSTFRSRRKAIGLSRAAVSHNEGRLGRHSGESPLEAPAKCSVARQRFRECVDLLQPLFCRLSLQRSKLTNADIISIRTAVRGRLVLCVDKRAKLGCGFADRYHSMSTCRAIRRLLMHTYRREQDPLSKELLELLLEDQQGRDLWKLSSHPAITGFMKAHTMDWDEVLVHRCESRQVVEKYGWSGTTTVVDAVDICSTAQRRALTKYEEGLFNIGSARSCFAVKMVDKAIELLNLDVARMPKSRSVGKMKARDALSLLVRLKDTKLSPKAVIERIPEFVTLRETFEKLLPSCQKKHAQVSLDSLRNLARSRGLHVPPCGQKKADLIQMVASSKNQRQGQMATLDTLRKMVRQHGGEPLPKDKSGKKGSWKPVRCREFLLHQLPAMKVRKISHAFLTEVPRNKEEQVQQLSACRLTAQQLK